MNPITLPGGTVYIKYATAAHLLATAMCPKHELEDAVAEYSDAYSSVDRKLSRAVELGDLHAIDPLGSLSGIQRGHQTLGAAQIVHPQTHGDRVLGCQLARQPPAHADVTEVVHHGAKQVPVRRRGQGRARAMRTRRQVWGQTRKKTCTDCAQSALSRRGGISSTIATHALPSLVDSFLNQSSQ